ncbi:B3 domain-containing protein Os01g0234100-like [Henckelia pumila]|uniref:B3 domain-containing protein Os01g0234100-like n=1 Tax=Henckelia pumila TaxID=405737 RepID=UPI003C6E6A2E
MDPSSDSEMLSDRARRLMGKKRAHEGEEMTSNQHPEEKTVNLNRFVIRPTKVEGATQNSIMDVPSTIGNARTGIVKEEHLDHSPQRSYQEPITPATGQHDGSHSDGSGGSQFSASVAKFQGVKGFEDFKISVDGLILDSELPMDVRVKYYELCSSQKMFLHDNLITGLGSKLVSGMISDTTSIADAIKSASVTDHSLHNLECKEKTLKAFEALGMNVGFLCARIDMLVKISRRYQAINQPKDVKFAQVVAKKKALEERVTTMEALQKSIATLQESIKILEAEIDGIEGTNEELGLEFKEIASASW